MVIQRYMLMMDWNNFLKMYMGMKMFGMNILKMYDTVLLMKMMVNCMHLTMVNYMHLMMVNYMHLKKGNCMRKMYNLVNYNYRNYHNRYNLMMKKMFLMYVKMMVNCTKKLVKHN